MKEQSKIENNQPYELVYPQEDVVVIPESVDFAYILRKDVDFVAGQFSSKMLEKHPKYFGDAEVVFAEKYEKFTNNLIEVLAEGFSDKGKVQMHVFEASDLDEKVKSKIDNPFVVSLDPLMHEGVEAFAVSRGYYFGGIVDFGQVNRPGSISLADQAALISEVVAGQKVTVVEDDVFSGGSLMNALANLMNAGVEVDTVIPGIQIGEPSALKEMGIEVNPVVKYEVEGDHDIFDKVDLGDPRDYLVGASGLVQKKPGGGFVRSPYVLPFVNVSERAGISTEVEVEFSEKILELNMNFYKSLEESLGFEVGLWACDDHFSSMMIDLFGFSQESSMIEVLEWSLENFDAVWTFMKELGKFQESKDLLQFPDNMIFIDVNGTLISDDAKEWVLDPQAVVQIQEVVVKLKEKGVCVGLCSDSPLDQLQWVADQLGWENPLILAESGSVWHFNGETSIVGDLPIEEIKQKVIAAAHDDLQVSDVVAVEFGGESPDYSKGEWGFGKGRSASVSVFADSELILRLGQVFEDHSIIDVSHEHNFFAMGSGTKESYLSALNLLGCEVFMVGNSMSDWVQLGDGSVKSAFVSSEKIPKGKGAYVSSKELAWGVIDILKKIEEEA